MSDISVKRQWPPVVARVDVRRGRIDGVVLTLNHQHRPIDFREVNQFQSVRQRRIVDQDNRGAIGSIDAEKFHHKSARH